MTYGRALEAKDGTSRPEPPQPSTTATRWQVGECTVDLVRRVAMSASRQVEIRPKAWDLLCLLLQQPNCVVRSDELLEALWPRQEVLPKVLVNLVSELRLRLGKAQTLKAIPRRGYLLLATPADPVGEPRHRVRMLGGAADVEVFVGRQHETSRWQALASATATQGLRVMSVHGRAGVGKTTMLRHGVHQLRHKGWTVLSGACVDATGVIDPFAPLLRALQQWTRQGGVEAVDLLRQYAPCWLSLLPKPIDTFDGPGPVLSGSEVTAARLNRELLALLQRLVESGPAVMVLDDLHWADAATLSLLLGLLPTLTDLPLMVALSWRTQELPQALTSLLARLDAAPLNAVSEVYELRCFTADEASDYLNHRLPEQLLASPARAEVHRLTEGLPLFLKLLCDNHTEPPVGPARPGEHTSPHDLTGRLRKHLHDRVAQLPSSLRSLMEVVSCMTTAAPVPLLAQCLDTVEATVVQSCRALVDLGLLEKASNDCTWADSRVVAVYAPSHSLIREAVAARLHSDVKRALNRRIALALSAVESPNSDLRPHLAHAYVGAGMHVEAARALRDCGLRWLAGPAVRPALQALIDALDQLGADHEDQGEVADLKLGLCTRIAQIQPFNFRTDNALHKRALNIILGVAAHSADPQWRFVSGMHSSTLQANEGRVDLARASAERLLAASQSLQPNLQAGAYSCLAFVTDLTGEYTASLAATDIAMTLLRPSLSTAEWSPWIAMLRAHRGQLLACTGDLAEFKAALEWFNAPGPHRHTPAVLAFGSMCLANALARLGCAEAAKNLYELALATEAEHGFQAGCDYAWMGEFACQPAEERDINTLRTFLAAALSRGTSRGVHIARLLIIDGLLARRQWADAGTELSAAAEIAAQFPALRTSLTRLRGRLAHAQGNTHAACTLWRHALDIDLEQRNLPGALRCANLLGKDGQPDKEAAQRCSAEFPEWLDADLSGKGFAPLAEAQRRHRLALSEQRLQPSISKSADKLTAP